MLNLKTEQGFTLLEVVVAVSVMAVVLIAAFRLQSQTILMNITARFNAMAPMLAQEKLAEVENAGLEELTAGSGDFGEHFPGYVWTVDVEDIESEYLGDTTENLKKITVSVSLESEGMSYGFSTFRMFEEEKE